MTRGLSLTRAGRPRGRRLGRGRGARGRDGRRRDAPGRGRRGGAGALGEIDVLDGSVVEALVDVRRLADVLRRLTRLGEIDPEGGRLAHVEVDEERVGVI